ncbi:hypothetical protein [Pseudolactococcus insecticola]|uniref:Uncharacterized protein n=1 Tax=Pseudolactococcus insecticola TaxID=2709158 RepID=A0A6A0B7N2_9LACT|nr:hypothetical protein [Lactococcus insecticola]GFH40663.1 hypothetical protein Hs20B_10610 [Lactococcus insecticola]
MGITLDKATEDKVGSSVGEKEFLGIWFTNTTKWSTTNSSKYPYEAIAKLWKKGFIPSFDGKTWRLSSGKKGKIVYQGTLKQLKAQVAKADKAAKAKATKAKEIKIAAAAGAVIIIAIVTVVVIKKRK